MSLRLPFPAARIERLRVGRSPPNARRGSGVRPAYPANLEKRGLVEHAVECEPVSAEYPWITGKEQGKSAKNPCAEAESCRDRPRKSADFGVNSLFGITGNIAQPIREAPRRDQGWVAGEIGTARLRAATSAQSIRRRLQCRHRQGSRLAGSATIPRCGRWIRRLLRQPSVVSSLS